MQFSFKVSSLWKLTTCFAHLEVFYSNKCYSLIQNSLSSASDLCFLIKLSKSKPALRSTRFREPSLQAWNNRSILVLSVLEFVTLVCYNKVYYAHEKCPLLALAKALLFSGMQIYDIFGHRPCNLWLDYTVFATFPVFRLRFRGRGLLLLSFPMFLFIQRCCRRYCRTHSSWFTEDTHACSFDFSRILTTAWLLRIRLRFILLFNTLSFHGREDVSEPRISLGTSVCNFGQRKLAVFIRCQKQGCCVFRHLNIRETRTSSFN